MLYRRLRTENVIFTKGQHMRRALACPAKIAGYTNRGRPQIAFQEGLMRSLLVQLLAWFLLPPVTVYPIVYLSPHGLVALMLGGMVLGALGFLAVLVRFSVHRRTRRRGLSRALEGGALGLMSLPIVGLLFDGGWQLTFAENGFLFALIILLTLIGAGIGVAVGRLLLFFELEPYGDEQAD